MRGHTPGPWIVGFTYDRAWPVFRLRDMVDGSSEEVEANRRLIAAAPDLLEAARFAVAYFALIDPGPLKHLRTLRESIYVLDKAIAKAEGSTS